MTTSDTHAGPPDPPDELPLPTTAGPAPPTADRMRLRLRRPADLVAALPHLLGFVPTDSVVLVALHARAGRTEIGAVTRADLVAPDHLAAMIGACTRRMGRHRPDDVVAVVVGGAAEGGPPPSPEGGPPPRADVIEVVEAMFGALRVPVGSRLWVPRIAAGERWCCYPPCDCAGVLPDPAGSAAAMATTVLGQVTFGSRAELEELVRPSTGAGSPRRAELLRAAAADAALDRELAGPAAARRDHDAVRQAARELAGGGVLGDAEIARVAVALLDPHVRDACLGWATGSGTADGVPPAAAELLWTVLTREVPAPEVAEPATLLACAVLVRGGGALVGAALDRAAAADPDHTLSRLVAALLDRGADRTQILEWIEASSAESERMLAAGVPRGRGAEPE